MTKFKVGDRVRITRRAESHEQGWKNSWESPEMDRTVGKIGTVVNINPVRHDIQVRVPRCDNWGFPSFVLELVPKKKTSEEMKFTLPISPDYVAHWGLWEAVREIYQNALDQGEATISYDEDTHVLFVSSATGRLTPETLVLGNTSKRNDPKKRGKFGEGYKLALLVLARLGHQVAIHTDNEVWTPALEHDPTFNTVVLNIHTQPIEPSKGVLFIIQDVLPEHYDTIQERIRPEPNEPDTILDDEGQAGRVFVGGLYVATVKDFQCGYTFRPGTIKLDRDRGMVDGFDLSYETSRLWTARGGGRAVELLKAEAPDVTYVEQHSNPTSQLTMHSVNCFHRTHGLNAIPVSSQDEIQRATTAGIKWVLVPAAMRNIIRLVKSWVIPTQKSPLTRLQDFRQLYLYHLPIDGRRELDEIIETMEGKTCPNSQS